MSNRKPGRRSPRAAVAVLLVSLALVGCSSATADPGGTAGPTPAPSGAAPAPPPAAAPEEPTEAAPSTNVPSPAAGEEASTTALATARQLTVKGRAPKTGYERDLFGQGWVDVDSNGCDTRNDILARDLEEETFKPGTRDCVVFTGTLADPYSGSTIDFLRGNDTSNDVQIDHVVALSDAWQKGAQSWDESTRAAFANDPMNLLAVDGPLNAQKGDGDAATWLPPNTAYRCSYVARQVGVKHTYGLWVTQAEQDAMVRVLSSCPDQPLPAGADGAAPAASAPAPAPPATIPPAAEAPPAPVPAPAPVAFANCSAARAAGAAPVRAGEPGYGAHLDRDGDGVGCE
ncbi:DUF1524 domain-containing protein [Georgenia sp. AZ-5]|uniref:GmrSD restriction endonuclease domain-containing protein n=1 Tax=Georgenia sp. AZ-5 TaxID=3367526 RepID=UPI0037549108